MKRNDSPSLLFVSPRFLFPVDSGGKIRTTQILRGMKGGRFRIHLLSPGSRELVEAHHSALAEVCDDFSWWPVPNEGPLRLIKRAWYLLDELPMPVRCDRSRQAMDAVSRALQAAPSVCVFDFLHAAILAPEQLDCPSVIFTHNVETEIFVRHASLASNVFMRSLWDSQHRKMMRFEAANLTRFDVVVAVSVRDARTFEQEFGVRNVHVIPTGVDLEYFYFSEPRRERDIVFCGSMDWLANQDGIRFFMDSVWPRIASEVPDARMTVVGRAPPTNLVAAVAARGLPWRFTGFVDDVRPIVAGAAVSVIPLRIGGGTRLKVFEAMAMGAVVVSTSVGVEGLPVVAGKNCLVADSAEDFARAVVELLQQPERRFSMALDARRFVEAHFGHRVVARSFEEACMWAMVRRAEGAAHTPDRSSGLPVPQG